MSILPPQRYRPAWPALPFRGTLITESRGVAPLPEPVKAGLIVHHEPRCYDHRNITNMRLLLIPSARLAPIELQAQFGPVPSAMIPVGGHPALWHVHQMYRRLGYLTAVAVSESAAIVETYAQKYLPEVTVINVGPTRSLGETISAALDHFVAVEHLVINYADTYSSDHPEMDDAAFYQVQLESSRWTFFSHSPDGRITAIIDKGNIQYDYREGPVFTGTFYIKNPVQFNAILKLHVANPQEGIDPFYATVQEYYNDRAHIASPLYAQTDWRDLGHLDKYYQAVRSFHIGTRYFNSICVDEDRGLLLKEIKPDSEPEHKAKFISEIQWYLHLPAALQYLVPRVIDFNINEPHFVELEYYGYPTLADLYLTDQSDDFTWLEIFNRLLNILEQFRQFCSPDVSCDGLLESMQRMYITKTLERLAKAQQQNPRLEELISTITFINDHPIISGSDLPGEIRKALEGQEISSHGIPAVLHGDLCFSNILFDRRTNIVRLIDPRGSFGRFSIHGDQRYDIAKLLHSAEGDYDLILNNRFAVKVEDRKAFLNVDVSASQQRVKKIVNGWLHAHFNEHLPELRLIESVLFLSMLPYHSDRPLQQEALLLRGLELFASWSRTSKSMQTGAGSQ